MDRRSVKRLSRKRSPRKSPNRILGGWKSVPKTNPTLWKKVLAEVKRLPGPWAAWKAIRADQIYISRGGRFKNY
jgi:hypothetical protein